MRLPQVQSLAADLRWAPANPARCVLALRPSLAVLPVLRPYPPVRAPSALSVDCATAAVVGLRRNAPSHAAGAEHKIWLVSFMNYDLGFFDQECGRVTSAENPFAPQNGF